MQLASGNLIVLVSVSIAFHALHKEVAEHPMLSFFNGLQSRAAAVMTVKPLALLVPWLLWLGGGNQHVRATAVPE